MVKTVDLLKSDFQCVLDTGKLAKQTLRQRAGQTLSRFLGIEAEHGHIGRISVPFDAPGEYQRLNFGCPVIRATISPCNVAMGVC